MADFYIVTVEDAQDGTFWDDPEETLSLTDAERLAERKKKPPGHVAGIYECHFVKAVGDA